MLSGQECPFNAKLMQSGLCLYLVPGSGLPWADAEWTCSLNGGHLVSITDSVMQGEVEKLMEEAGVESVWTGLTEGHDKLWKWSEGE